MVQPILRWFLGIALRIPTAHDFRVISAPTRVGAKNVRTFPQTKLDNEKNAPFLLNEHGDPHFLFHNFNEDNILHNWEKRLSEIYGYFFGKWNKYYRERYISGPTPHVQIVFPLKDKKMQGIWKKFSGTWMSKQSKKVELCVMYHAA